MTMSEDYVFALPHGTFIRFQDVAFKDNGSPIYQMHYEYIVRGRCSRRHIQKFLMRFVSVALRHSLKASMPTPSTARQRRQGQRDARWSRKHMRVYRRSDGLVAIAEGLVVERKLKKLTPHAPPAAHRRTRL